MGLFQRACETYDNLLDYVGIYEEGKVPLAPIGHTIKRLNIEITIDNKGNFITARNLNDEIGKDNKDKKKDKSKNKVIVPVTEKSMNRSSGIAAHPLCDQLQYVTDKYKERHESYVNMLSQWNEFDPDNEKISAILSYVKNNSIINDLSKTEIIKLKDNMIDKKDDKLFVGWVIIGTKSKTNQTWNDFELFDSFNRFYSMRDAPVGIDMITGKKMKLSKLHSREIFSSIYKARLISKNCDEYLNIGNLLNSDEVVSIGYESSQKANNTIRWLVDNQGIYIGGNKYLLCWNTKGKKIVKPVSPIIRNAEDKIIPSDYKKKIYDYIYGLKNAEDINPDDKIVIVILDSLVDTRICMKYYEEFSTDSFFEKMIKWDETCCVNDSYKGTYSPSVYEIVECAFGVADKKDEYKFIVKDKEKKYFTQKLLEAKFNNGEIPQYIYENIVRNASCQQKYKKQNYELLSVACAVIRKYRYDKYKEEWSLELEQERKDLSYQYGRLLAVFEKIEKDATKSKKHKCTNAIKLQTSFSLKPMHTSRLIYEKLNKVYIPKLYKDNIASAIYYDKIISQVYDELSNYSDDELRRPLDDTYLMGYQLQKNYFYKSNNKNTEVETNEQ